MKCLGSIMSSNGKTNVEINHKIEKINDIY